MREISARTLKEQLDSSTPPVVIDVREQWERNVASVPDTVHIPMHDVPDRLDDIRQLTDDDREVVVMCHSGGRSMTVARFLQQNGFERVINLSGGIDAWSKDVDNSVPTY